MIHIRQEIVNNVYLALYSDTEEFIVLSRLFIYFMIAAVIIGLAFIIVYGFRHLDRERYCVICLLSVVSTLFIIPYLISFSSSMRYSNNTQMKAYINDISYNGNGFYKLTYNNGNDNVEVTTNKVYISDVNYVATNDDGDQLQSVVIYNEVYNVVIITKSYSDQLKEEYSKRDASDSYHTILIPLIYNLS